MRRVAIFHHWGSQDHIALRDVDDAGRYGPVGPVVAVTTSREATIAVMRLLCGHCLPGALRAR